MTKNTVYIYKGENGTIQTPVKLPIQEDSTMTRLSADDGKELVKNDIHTSCIDVENDDIGNWKEMELPKDDKTNK